MERWRFTNEQQLKRMKRLFFLSMFIGIVIMCLGRKVFLTETDFMSADVLYQMKYASIEGAKVVPRVIGDRLMILFALILLSTTWLGPITSWGYFIWIGMTGGMLFSALLVRFGLKGILLFLAMLFPQCFLYIPGYLFFFVLCQQIYKAVCGGQSRDSVLKELLFPFILVLVVVIIGCLLESYVNVFLLKKLLLIF